MIGFEVWLPALHPLNDRESRAIGVGSRLRVLELPCLPAVGDRIAVDGALLTVTGRVFEDEGRIRVVVT